jgi:hypothetical protein
MTALVCVTPRRPLALVALAAVLAFSACSSKPDAEPATVRRDSGAVQRPELVPVMPLELAALAPRPGAIVTRIVVRRDTSTFGVGPAVVTLASGDTLVVSDSAYRVWSLGRSSLVAVSGLDGAGGFENEGQSLTVIDVATGTRRRVVADYFPIVRVQFLESAAHRALLVHMRDGGHGSLHVTVVDPARGQVFRMLNALGRIEGDRILVAGFGDGETAVEFGDRRTPLRVDTLLASVVDTLSLMVVPRSPK